MGKLVPAYVSLDDEDAIRDCVRKSNVVINLVGKHYETKHFLPHIINSPFREVHVNIPERIARIAREEYVDHFVHVSALSANPDSESEFARTKFEGEEKVKEQFPGAVIVRPGSMYGQEDRFLNWFARILKYSGVFPVVEGLKQKVLPVFVGDVATAVAKCAVNYSTCNKTYELAEEKEWTRSEILDLVMKTTRKHRQRVDIPKSVAFLIAQAIELLPSPVLTRDWLKLMLEDEVRTPGLPGFKELEMETEDFEKKSFAFLYVYQQGGHFADDEALKQT
jgi:NADH dehydrogenase (ubiquinone) 1 alpha subcomplex subunit 9